MKPKPESKYKAYVKPEYQMGSLPNDNPFGFKSNYKLPDKNTKEYKQATKMVKDFLNRPHKGTPVSGSKIAF